MEMLSRSETARLMGTSIRTIDRLKADGRLPFVDISAGKGRRPIVRFLATDVRCFIQRNRKDIMNLGE